MTKLLQKKAVVALLPCILAACGTVGDGPAKLVASVKQGDYPTALSIASAEDFYESNANRLLKALDLGVAKYLNNDYKGALADFERAKQISLELRTKSISKTAAAQVVGDGVKPYVGEKYETSMIRFFIALTNYRLYLQEPENSKYADGVSANAKDWNAFVNNAEEIYLDMMQKSWTASIDKEKTAKLLSNMKKIFKDAYSQLPSLKKDGIHAKEFNKYVDNAQEIEKSNTLILVKQGLIQPKKAVDIALPLPTAVTGTDLYKMVVGDAGIMFQYTTMDKPELAKYMTVQIKNEAGKTVFNKPMVLISPLSELAFKQFKDSEKSRITTKSARLIVKYTAAIATAKAAYDKVAGTGAPAFAAKSAAVAAFKGASKLIAMSEYADVRQWELLPANIYQQNADLKAGKYSVELKNGDKTVYTGNFEVHADLPSLIDISIPNL